MENKIDERLVKNLVKQVEELPPAFPAGAMSRSIREFGSYDDLGLIFTDKDYEVGLYYAGLAVLARDMHQYIAEHPREDAGLFAEVVSAVHDVESTRYGDGAFPNYANLPATSLPTGMAAAADAGKLAILPLRDPAIVHEWTTKAGKRLFVKFGAKFKSVICGPDGPYVQSNGLGSALPTTIMGAILAAGFSAATFWYPLAVYLSLLLIKTGLKTYCETESD
jgi:hypothetical protein